MQLTAGIRHTAARALCAGLLTAIASTAGAQTTRSLAVDKDATIRGGSYASTRYGTASHLVTRRSDDATYERRAVLTFDTETTIPDNSAIQSARLVLTVRGGNAETRQLAAHAIPVSFDEPDVTWRVRKSGIAWRYAGGEVTGSPATASVTGTPGSQVTFDVTALVQRVVNGTFGSRYARFLIADAGAASRESYREFHSGEASTTSYWPRLIVTYGGPTSTSGGTTSSPPTSSGADIVLATGSATTFAGRWARASDSSAAGGVLVRHPNANASKVSSAQASPANYFEMTFTAEAGRPYRLWVHGRADNDYWANDSVFVQFSGSVTSSGSATYRIGTASATEVNLEECSGCGLAGWKWQDNGYGRGVLGPAIYFAATGTQRIRIQTREDGLAIDRIVLSPATYLTSAPPAMGGTAAAAPPPPTSTTTTTTSPSPTTSTSDSTSTSTTLKVLHWNVRHGGVGTDGRLDPGRIAYWIAQMRPDVISLNEVDNTTQATALINAINSRTGVTWKSSFSGWGNLLLTRLALSNKSICDINLAEGRKGAHLTTVVNGRLVNLWSVHLDVSSQTDRIREVRATQSCEQSWPEVRIVAGDFNAQASSTEIGLMTYGHVDAWPAAKALGTATNYAGNCDGCTRNSRIDYVFLSKGASYASVRSARIYDTRDSNGVMPSDHKPLLVTYSIR